MSQRGKGINIYLDDGSPTGIKHIEMGGWIGQVIVCPRSRVSQLVDWSESQRPGVYLLLGEDEEAYRPRIYIGEAEDVLKRLRSQLGEKDFWKQAFIFTSKDENLTKAHVKYLESCMIKKIREYGRVMLENTNNPNLPALPRSDRATMDEYLDCARDILTTIGFPYLHPVIRTEPTIPSSSIEKSNSLQRKDSENEYRLAEIPDKKPHYFFFSGRGIKGQGVSTDEGFVVLSGSLGNLKTTKSIHQKWKDKRNSLIAQELISVIGHQIRFDKDVLFNSSSAAATTLAGGMRNGQDVWKDSTNRTLKQYEEDLSDIRYKSAVFKKPSGNGKSARRNDNQAPLSKSTAGGRSKKALSFTFKGTCYETKSQIDAYAKIIELMEQENPGFLDRLAPELSYSKTKALARSEDELASPESLEKGNIARQITDEWWLYTKINRKAKIRNLKIACNVAGIAFGKPDGLMVDF